MLKFESVSVGLSVRKAAVRDIPHLLALINDYAAKGIMLPRTEFELAESLRDFHVAFRGEELVACGALHFYSPTFAEIRSLAVRPDLNGLGLGRAVVDALESEGRDYGICALFAFTYVPGFFSRLGWEIVERGILPLKVWRDCVRCPKFQNCDEIAVLKWLDPDAAKAQHALEHPYVDALLPVLQR